ncbi:hypothetical protein BU23DRAFT_572735 [Bimuria novae-zelandiae CBS 107.79]|uniref:Uncharacterized protein n=1 Tax=Bimuria novae-zelandiae CBS 107.79 TaxID=1447943 RepID=A0A6A5USV9_9PLEO|nr:hypothetical protein BU23DRAFT_572735 [Bimuria novae-zelandiae CBS 107.79]
MRGLATLVIREWSLCLTVLYCGRLAKIVLEAFFILSYFGVCIIVVFFEFLLTMVLNLTQLNVSGVVDELIDIYWFMWEHHMRKPLSVLMEVLETKRMKIILPITTAYLWWKVGRGAKKYYFGDPQTQIARACASMAFTSSFLVVARLKCLQLPIYSKLRLPGEAHLSDDQARKLDKRFAAAPNFPLVPLITIPLVLYFGAITALMIGFGMRRRPTVLKHLIMYGTMRVEGEERCRFYIIIKFHFDPEWRGPLS